ncbi:MAG TPA: hypothetical protein VKB75_12630 [Jatrophihabitans sp.]|nr:hypothetical protein [Jatrophihabitans sp.]
MTIHQCPKCVLRFSWQTELDDHCRSEHPEFQHDYPATVHNDNSLKAVRVAGQKPARSRGSETAETSAFLRTWWNER